MVSSPCGCSLRPIYDFRASCPTAFPVLDGFVWSFFWTQPYASLTWLLTLVVGRPLSSLLHTIAQVPTFFRHATAGVCIDVNPSIAGRRDEHGFDLTRQRFQTDQRGRLEGG